MKKMIKELFGRVDTNILNHQCDPYVQSRINHIIRSVKRLGRDKGKRFAETTYPTVWLIHALVINNQPDTVIETGTCTGYTTNAIADALEYNGHGRVYTFELNEVWMKIAQETARVFDLSPYIKFITGDIHKTFSKTLEKIDNIDFVYHDIDPKEDYLWEQKLMENKIPSGGMVIAHDTYPNDLRYEKGIIDFLDYMEEKYFHINLPYERGLLLAIKK